MELKRVGNTKMRIMSVSIHQMSLVVGSVGAAVALVLVVPLLLIVSLGHGTGAPPRWLILLGPLIYGIGGYVQCAFYCWLFNLVAGYWGGIEVTIADYITTNVQGTDTEGSDGLPSI